MREIVDKALQMAREEGASNVRITVERDTESSATALNGKVDKILSASGSTMFIDLFIDGRFGTFTTNMLQEDALRAFIRRAASATRLLAPDPCRGLPDPALYFRGPAKDLKQYDAGIEALTMPERIEMALQASNEIWGTNEKLLSVETEWGDDSEHTWVADSQGFSGETLTSNHTINAQVSIKGRGDEKPEAWWYESGITRAEAPIEGCSTKALQRALDQLHPRKAKSGRYSIVVDNTVSSRLVSPLIRALSGGYLQQGQSFLADSLGQKIFGESLTLTDCPHIPGLPGSRLFDDEGMATKERKIIDRGTVSTWFISSYYSRKMGIPPTTAAPSVLRFSDGKAGNGPKMADLMKAEGRGILITDFNGGNCNQATGDFSYGIRGFLFENGEKVHPIREMNITGNMIRLWNSLIGVGSDPRKGSKWAVPSLAFSDVDFSGI